MSIQLVNRIERILVLTAALLVVFASPSLASQNFNNGHYWRVQRAVNDTEARVDQNLERDQAPAIVYQPSNDTAASDAVTEYLIGSISRQVDAPQAAANVPADPTSLCADAADIKRWRRWADEERDFARQWREIAEERRRYAREAKNRDDQADWDADAQRAEDRAEDLDRAADRYDEHADEAEAQAEGDVVSSSGGCAPSAGNAS